MDYQPLENYGVIGNMNTAALVGINGSIDFLCFPSFESPSIFAAILDQEKGGCFFIKPDLENVSRRQMYLPETNILLTRFLSPNGACEILDFMPVEERPENNFIIRRVKSIREKIKFKMKCMPRFNYAKSKHTAKINEDEIIFTSEDEGISIRLRSNKNLTLKGKTVIQYFFWIKMKLPNLFLV